MASHLLHITRNVCIPETELSFRTTRSRGPGGQNVNKLETRVQLSFDVANSPSLSEDQKNLILSNLSSRIDSEGILSLSSQATRSQWQNKQLAIDRFVMLMMHALLPKRERHATKPTTASRDKRLQRKQLHSAKKSLRRKPSIND